MNKNIAIIFSLSEYGGVQTCVISLIKGLNKKGIIPTLIWGNEPNLKIIKENNLKVKFEDAKFLIPTKFIHSCPSSIRHILWPFNIIKASKLKNKYDFIYTFTHLFHNDLKIPFYYYLSGPPFLPQLYPQRGIPKIRYKILHNLYNIFLRPFLPIYEFQGNSDNTGINSKFTSDLFYEAHNIKLPVVYPSNSFVKDEVLGFENKKEIIFLSRIVPYKKPELILELAKKYLNEKFLIIGTVPQNRDEYYKKLVKFVEDNNLTNVEFKLDKKYDEVQIMLKKAKIYVFPTENEHFGITTVEAIINGVIPFVHNSGGQKEIVDLDDFRFEYGDFFEKFDNLIKKDNKELEKIQKHFYEHSDTFSEEVFINKLLKKGKI